MKWKLNQKFHYSLSPTQYSNNTTTPSYHSSQLSAPFPPPPPPGTTTFFATALRFSGLFVWIGLVGNEASIGKSACVVTIFGFLTVLDIDEVVVVVV